MSKDLFWVEPPFLYTVATNSLHIKVHSLGCLLVVPHFSLTRLYVECVKVKVSYLRSVLTARIPRGTKRWWEVPTTYLSMTSRKE